MSALMKLSLFFRFRRFTEISPEFRQPQRTRSRKCRRAHIPQRELSVTLLGTHYRGCFLVYLSTSVKPQFWQIRSCGSSLRKSVSQVRGPHGANFLKRYSCPPRFSPSVLGPVQYQCSAFFSARLAVLLPLALRRFSPRALSHSVS